MNEKPILFSAPMVKAILNGTKTQTRRIIAPRSKHQEHWREILESSVSCRLIKPDMAVTPAGVGWLFECENGNAVKLGCPHGDAGDHLWVKETHLPKASGTIYRADYDPIESAGIGAMYGGWKPSISCKRIYSRITLEIVSVRVERLMDISEDDARAEGYPAGEINLDCSAFVWYRKLWETINGEGSWQKNPWCWVISFKRIQP